MLIGWHGGPFMNIDERADLCIGNDLTFRSLRLTCPEDGADLCSAYRCWSRVWSATLKAGVFTEKCTSFLRVHAADEPDHLEKALWVAEQVPADLRPLVVQNLEQTTHGYLGMPAEIERQAVAEARVVGLNLDDLDRCDGA